MLWQRNYVSMTVGLLTIGLLHQLLVFERTTATTEVQTNPPQPKPAPVTTTSTTTTTTRPTTTTSTTKAITTATAKHSNTTSSSDACFHCKTGFSGGAIAGIVIGVLLFYIISLMLVAILVFVLTKRGTLDLNKWRLFQIISNRDKAKHSADLAVPNNYSDETLSPPAEVYTSLDARTREVRPPEASPYEALQMGDNKKHNLKPKIKKKPKTAVPQATDDEIYQNY